MFHNLASETLWFLIWLLVTAITIITLIVIGFIVYVGIKYICYLAKDLHLGKLKPLYTKSVFKFKEQIHYYTGIRFTK